jgi:SagB-type dehydrogenase family enzyme
VGEQPGEEFQQATRYQRDRMDRQALDLEHQPATFKLYTSVPVIPLPPPRRSDWPDTATLPEESLWRAMAERRSARRFTDQPLDLADLSQLLWAASGITRATPNLLYRTVPSAGGLYPIETYVLVNSVTALAPGVYHYRAVGLRQDRSLDLTLGHALEELRLGNHNRTLAHAALDQAMVVAAAAVFIWAAVFPRSRWKYRERAFRYVYLDAGHIAAHVSLAAVALGLGSCQIAAFYDDEVNSLIGVDGEEESALYLTTVGRPLTGP